MSTVWPEEQANQTSFYYNRPNSKKDGNDNDDGNDNNDIPYHLTFKNHDKQKQLILYNSETKEIVDVINPNDIIGAELEISFDSLTAATNKVGLNNDKTKERVEKMAEYEEKLGKKLIGGMMDDFQLSDNDDDDNGNSNSNNTDDDKDDVKKPLKGLECTSAAYLNIFCYPRSLPTPGLATLIKNCYKDNSSPIVKKLGDEIIVQDDMIDESKLGNRYEKHRRYKLFPTEDFSDVQQLIPAIRKIANLGHFETEPNASSVVRRKKYLVIVNPFSGTKNGKKIYDTLMKKMLQECGVDHDVLITQYAGHASERMKKDDDDNHKGSSEIDDISEYNAVVCIGGDGILSEVIKGLKSRNDFETLAMGLKLGIVGGGTCNGLAASLLHAQNESYGVLESIFRICKGQASKLDLSTYQTKTKSYTAFLTFCWAMISDIDIDSECIRFMGVLRNDIWGAWRVLKMKSYKARFSYLPADDDSVGNMKSSYDCPKLTDDVPSNWVSIEDDFILFWASQVTHAAHNVLQSPESKLQDGVFRIFIVRKPCSRIEMAGILIDMEKGNHTSYERAEFYDCAAFRLDPLSAGSYNDVDGEVVEAGRIQAHVLPAALNIFC